jgi:hypothetical protein
VEYSTCIETVARLADVQGFRAGKIAAAPVKTDPRQISKRRSRGTMTMEVVAHATLLLERLAATQKLADGVESLERLS